MRHTIWTSVLASVFLLTGSAYTKEPGKADRLFRSNDVLEVTISAPFKTLMNKRSNEEDLPGKLSYVDEAGATVEFDIGVRARGLFRRQKRVCPFPPIRLNIKKSEAKDTLFRKQDKLKLVTHCRNGSERYEQVAMREYLAYRFLNELTDFSFRVRLLRITYVNTDRSDDEEIRYGFVIEHRDRLAKRIDLPRLEIKHTSVASLASDHTNLASVFQYFIANTDYSPIASAPDSFCCHNGNLFGKVGQPYYSIPYDFDMAGLVDAPYAEPNPQFTIRNVRQRLYRGRCQNNGHLPDSLQQFRDKKETFYSMVENMADLSNVSKNGMYVLIDRFYDLINDPDDVEKKMVRKCV